MILGVEESRTDVQRSIHTIMAVDWSLSDEDGSRMSRGGSRLDVTGGLRRRGDRGRHASTGQEADVPLDPKMADMAEGRSAIRRKPRRSRGGEAETQQRHRRPKRKSEDRRWRSNCRPVEPQGDLLDRRIHGRTEPAASDRLCRSRLGPPGRMRNDVRSEPRGSRSAPRHGRLKGLRFLLPGFRHLVHSSCPFADQVAGVGRQV